MSTAIPKDLDPSLHEGHLMGIRPTQLARVSRVLYFCS